jgi:N-acetylmuramoyl-L-alanine amidase
MNRPKWIVIHTAAHAYKNEVYDTSAMEINNWHLQNGWKGIGYHYVIRFSGKLEKGREDNHTGAHTRGLNSSSIGICMSGHGDLKRWTNEQLQSVLKLVLDLMKMYNIPVENVIGHREASNIKGVPFVNKTCPGKLVDMDVFRELLKYRE